MKRSKKIRIWASGFFCGLVVLATLILVARTFVVEGLIARVETASGSMAPWLYGPHAEAACGDCGIGFVLDALDPATRDKLDCPNCGGRSASITSTRTIAGEQLLIDRRAFATHGPARWEPVVFQCPRQAGELCIKRVVGLPGEEIQIRGGDIYINGQIVRKSLDEQRQLAILVHDSRWRAADAGSSRAGWTFSKNNRRWQLAAGHFQYSGGNGEPPNAAPAGIRYRHLHRGRPSSVLDDYAYNQNVSRVLNPMSDLMLELELTSHGTGQIAFSAEAHGHRFDVDFQNPKGPAAFIRLRRNGATVDEARLPTSFDDRIKIEFSLIDRHVLLAINEDVILQNSIDEPRNDEAATAFSINAAAIDADLYDVRIWRDIHYTRPRTALWGFDEPCKLGQSEYFVLGDNSPISSDSRAWPAPGLASKSIIGRPLRTARQQP